MENLMGFILGIDKESDRTSCFMMALRSARYHMGRNIETGESYDNAGGTPVDFANRDSLVEHWMFDEEIFTGLVMYLILLDQIGCIFAKVGIVLQKKESGVKYALKCFSNFSNKEREAIYALRCTLAHNFGLTTEKANPKPHKFILSFDVDSKAVTLPTEKWDADYSDKSDGISTVIGVYALCDEIESVVDNVYDYYEQGKLQLQSDKKEICSRFTLIR